MSRQASSRSPSSLTRTGGHSFSGSSSASSAGCQLSRNIWPIGVPGPVWVRRSFCSFRSIGTFPIIDRRVIRRAAELLKPFQTASAVGSAVDQPAESHGLNPAPILLPIHLAREPPQCPPEVELCKADQVAAGTALRVEAAGLTVAVFNVDGQFYVTDDACTHGPGSLSEGFIDGDVVECNFHNGQFDIKTGEIVSPPCMIPVKTYPASVEGGAVFIEVD